MEFSGCKLEIVRQDDFVEYFVFPNLSTGSEPESHIKYKSTLENFQKQCLGYVDTLVKERNYIWHKDQFNLQVSLNQDSKKNVIEDNPPHLHGVTHYGDNIADEWFIVFLLGQLTLKYPTCIARIVDVDGEFLLIEAAEKLPSWANPDTCEQRVYIAQGYLHLVENSPGIPNDKVLSVSNAIRKLQIDPQMYRVSETIQNCINERIAEFHDAAAVAKEQHYQNVYIPVRVAALLCKQQNLIAPAIRAYCERDSTDIKALRSMRFFPPEECVRARVCFTRCLYAMIMHNNFIPDKRTGWKLSSSVNSEKYKEELLGIKIASGFEILAANAKEDDEMSPAWKIYMKSLISKGYFRNLLEGSQEYKLLYAEAQKNFKETNQRFRSYRNVGNEIISLLSELNDITADPDKILPPSDSDDWMNITAAELDETLMKRYGHKLFEKSDNTFNAEEFTQNLTCFLEKQSNFNGIELKSEDESSDNDNVVSPRKKSSMRRSKKHPVNAQQSFKGASMTTESTQMRNVLDFEVPEDSWESNSDMDDYDNEDEIERNFAAMANIEECIDKDIKEYMSQMDRELANTTIGKSFEKKCKQNQTNSSDDDFDDIESFEPININVNTLQSMMESYKSQKGGPGPASTILNVMGMAISNQKEKSDPGTKKDLTESTV